MFCLRVCVCVCVYSVRVICVYICLTKGDGGSEKEREGGAWGEKEVAEVGMWERREEGQ